MGLFGTEQIMRLESIYNSHEDIIVQRGYPIPLFGTKLTSEEVGKIRAELHILTEKLKSEKCVVAHNPHKNWRQSWVKIKVPIEEEYGEWFGTEIKVTVDWCHGEYVVMIDFKEFRTTISPWKEVA